MPTRESLLAGKWWRSWVGLLALLALVLLDACAAGPAQGAQLAASRYPPPASPQEAPARLAHRHAKQGVEGDGEAVFIQLPTDAAPVQVEQAPFTSAMTALLLATPLRVASATPVQPGGRLTPGTGGSGGEAWQSDLARSYQRFCERRGAGC